MIRGGSGQGCGGAAGGQEVLKKNMFGPKAGVFYVLLVGGGGGVNCVSFGCG